MMAPSVITPGWLAFATMMMSELFGHLRLN